VCCRSITHAGPRSVTSSGSRWTRRPIACLLLRDQYESDFDALEVFNGLDAYSHPRVRLVLRDWIAHLGRGFRYTATGNSDSHKLAFEDPDSHATRSSMAAHRTTTKTSTRAKRPSSTGSKVGGSS
jgi:hypothetical protein